MKYLLGIDGGGTKTVVCISDKNGIVKEQFYSGAFNLNGQGEKKTKDTLLDIFIAIGIMGYDKGDCEGIGIGAAGISNPFVSVFLKEEIQSYGFTCPIYVYGDQETALAAAFENCHGIIIIAGTGSICYGKDEKGNCVRAGGYGHLIDDVGSGYAIARDILKAIVRAEDGRQEDTILTSLIFGKLGIKSIEELIQYLYKEGRSKKEIADLAAVIEDAILYSDMAAMDIEKKNAEQLYQLFCAVKHKLPKEYNVVFSGSVLLQNQRIAFMLREKILKEYSEINIVEMRESAAVGALRLIRKEKEGMGI